MGARNKLNWMHIQLAMVVAVLAGAISGSWLVSLIVLTVFFAVAWKGNSIR